MNPNFQLPTSIFKFLSFKWQRTSFSLDWKDTEGLVKDRRVIYMYPKETAGNLYLTSCRSVFELGGAQVKSMPTSLVKLLVMLVSRKDCIVINWFEDRINKSHNQLFMLLKGVILLVLIRIIFHKVVWVRHNFRPHNTYSKVIYGWMLFWLGKFTDCQVTHRPVKKIKSYYASSYARCCSRHGED